MKEFNPVEHMLQQFTRGFGNLDDMKTTLGGQARAEGQKFREEEERQAAIAKAALDNDAGRAFVLLLMEKTILRAPSEEERTATTAEHFAILKARRDGQNQLVFTILAMLRTQVGAEQQGGNS